MNSTFFDLSGKIDPQTIAVFSALRNVADSLGIPFFVVGATARDFILKDCYGIELPRMTRDIDLAVEVASWEQFNKLIEALKDTGKFSPDKRECHRLHFDSLPIDMLPFGPIADADRKITWPPEHEVFMSVIGFKEAYESSITVRLSANPLLDIKLPTLPGLALMKIVSWKEKYPERRKDAEDLLLIMDNYESVGTFDRLYDTEQELLQEEKFDVGLASIRLLGRDMARMADPETLNRVKAILDDETREKSRYSLVTDMVRGSGSIEDRFEQIRLHVEKLRKGFLE
ncbi:MAG: nucleotidyl transferase AbiEii/AbiGii toxin family protein [Acidobacteriia bacterium]|nr:nucleotidyl transferase AbiEii/AbiGii toxin family protein [Terriglobia bacterium]